MPVNAEKVDRLLAALAAKDVDAIVAEQVTIPFLSKPYSKTRLTNWLAKRTNQLNNAKNATDEQILQVRNNLYNGLNATCKAVADKIIAGEQWEFPSSLSSANYDRLIGIHLLTFITE